MDQAPPTRYSHLGPVAQPKGVALSLKTIRTLNKANELLSWAAIARRCRVSRTTLYRVMCGGNAHALTIESIERFTEAWQSADDATIAGMLRRR
jgi:hypothetical protein